MAVLRAVKGDQEFPLRGKVTVLGRDPACDIVLQPLEVSSRHVVIVNAGAGYDIQDLDSVNGTYVNGQRLRQRVRLSDGDRIDIPGLSVVFSEGPTGEVPPEEQTVHATVMPPEPPPSVLSSLDVVGDWRVEVAPEAKLRAVLEITKNLGTTLDLKEVLPKILESLFTIFPQADRGFILLRDPNTAQLVIRAVRHRHEGRASPSAFSRTVVNYALQTGRAVLSADAGSDERFGISESIRALHLRSVMCVPMLSQSGAGLGVIQLDTLNKASQFRQADLDVLVSASLQAARAVELAQLHQELRDLEAAREIQKSFLPESRPRLEEFQFFDYYSPARHVSGDYYDYIPLPGNRLAVALGDVSGKGVPAALLMARMSAAVRFCLATAPSVAEAVRQLSRILTRVGTEDRFITFVVAVLDLTHHTMTLVNAGHMPPLRRAPARSGVEDVAAEEAGLPLAILDRPYEEVVVPLERGDTFLLYTDGVTEARNGGGELYGIDRLRQLVAGLPAEPEALGRGVLADIGAFVGDRPQSDDVTVVCFGRKR